MAKQSFSVGQVLTAAQMLSLQQTAMLGGSTTAKTTSYTLVAADAGTVVSVSSTSATTITVNTALFSAGDTVTIQNWGTGSVTITAGTATVNTAGSLIVPQYDGGVLYFTSASAAIYFDFVQAGGASPLTTKGDLYGFSTIDARIPIGTNGHVLTADSTQTLGLKWAAVSGGASFVGASAYLSGNQSIANASYVALQFGSENFDTDGFHDNTTNNTRMTIPSGKAGKYSINCLVSWGTNGVGDRKIGIAKNGSIIMYPARINPCTVDDTAITGSVILDLIVGDYIEIYAAQASGGALNVLGGSTQSQFAVSLLGA